MQISNINKVQLLNRLNALSYSDKFKLSISSFSHTDNSYALMLSAFRQNFALCPVNLDFINKLDPSLELIDVSDLDRNFILAFLELFIKDDLKLLSQKIDALISITDYDINFDSKAFDDVIFFTYRKDNISVDLALYIKDTDGINEIIEKLEPFYKDLEQNFTAKLLAKAKEVKISAKSLDATTNTDSKASATDVSLKNATNKLDKTNSTASPEGKFTDTYILNLDKVSVDELRSGAISERQSVFLNFNIGRSIVPISLLRQVQVGDAIAIDEFFINSNIMLLSFDDYELKADIKDMKIIPNEIFYKKNNEAFVMTDIKDAKDTDTNDALSHNDGSQALDNVALDDVKLEVLFEIERQTLSLKSLAEIKTGSILTLHNKDLSHIKVSINNQYVATGRVIDIGDRFALQITELKENEQ